MHKPHSKKMRMSELASSVIRQFQTTDSVSHQESNVNLLLSGNVEKIAIKGKKKTGAENGNGVTPPKDEDHLVDMKYITTHSGLSDKFFYALIRRGAFPRPIKIGRSSRWKMSEFKQWIEERAAAR